MSTQGCSFVFISFKSVGKFEQESYHDRQFSLYRNGRLWQQYVPPNIVLTQLEDTISPLLIIDLCQQIDYTSCF